MSTSSSRESLLRLLDPVVSELGLDLEDVVITPAGKRRLLRVVVDQDGGVELDVVARVSTAVSAALDEDDTMGRSPYVLEVTSPGVDRPLTKPQHWRRNRGRLVQVVLVDGTPVLGRVVDATDTGLHVDVAGTRRQLPWDDVERGHVQVEFNRRSEALEDPTSPTSRGNGSGE